MALEFIDISNVEFEFEDIKQAVSKYPKKINIYNKETKQLITYFFFSDEQKGMRKIYQYVPCFVLQDKNGKRAFFAGYMGNFKSVTANFQKLVKMGFNQIAHL